VLGVVILAGGKSTRLPNKLERPLRGEPMVVRVFRNVRKAGNAYVCANGTFDPQIDDALACPVIIDRRPWSGPLTALLDALPHLEERAVFVVSADLPLVHAGVAGELRGALEPGDDAVVPLDESGRLQPLCALYDRAALLAAASQAVGEGKRSMHAALDSMNVRKIRLHDDFVLEGVNTPEEWVALRTIELSVRARA